MLMVVGGLGSFNSVNLLSVSLCVSLDMGRKASFLKRKYVDIYEMMMLMILMMIITRNICLDHRSCCIAISAGKVIRHWVLFAILHTQ